MIRRTFPELITNEIVGVQPMSGPVGLAFALRYAYQSEYALGTGIDGKTIPGTPAGGTKAGGAGLLTTVPLAAGDEARISVA